MGNPNKSPLEDDGKHPILRVSAILLVVQDFISVMIIYVDYINKQGVEQTSGTHYSLIKNLPIVAARRNPCRSKGWAFTLALWGIICQDKFSELFIHEASPARVNPKMASEWMFISKTSWHRAGMNFSSTKIIMKQCKIPMCHALRGAKTL